MRPFSFYDELLQLNKIIYTDKTQYKSWKQMECYDGSLGLHVGIFTNGKETAFVVRGTEVTSPKDILEDLMLWIRKTNAQAHDATQYYKKIASKYTNMLFTGHSLGGSIAQLLNKYFGNESVCFGPYGTGKHSGNVVNFGNIWDIVFMQNPNEMPGKTYLMSVPYPPDNKRGLYTHYLDNCGTPSNSKLCQQHLITNIELYNKQQNDKVEQKVKHVNDYLRKSILSK